jgi:hypothetical protein
MNSIKQAIFILKKYQQQARKQQQRQGLSQGRLKFLGQRRGQCLLGIADAFFL